MDPKYTEENQRLQRAIASAEYREFATEQEKLCCLLFTFSIKSFVVIKEMSISRDQIYYLVKKNEKVNPTAGRPRFLIDDEVELVKSELTSRAGMLKPAT